MASRPHDRSETPPIRTAKACFRELVVVCAKCAKRQGLSKREVGRSLKRALKQARPERKVKVIASGCLGPCPKRLVAVAAPAALRSGRLLLLDPACPESAAAWLAADGHEC